MRNPFRAPTIARVLLESAGGEVEEHEFFSYLRLGNGTFKTTEPGRLTDVDDLLAEELRRRGGSFEILDVATSSGTLAVELDRRLTREGIPHTLYASDLLIHAGCLCVPPWTILSEPDGTLLQVDLGRLAFPNTPPSKLSACVFLLARGVRKCAGIAGRCSRQFSLLSATARNSDVIFSRGDVWSEIFEADPEQRFDVIRAANLLHRSYFSDEAIRAAASNLHRFLKPQGLLVVARSDQTLNRTTIFERRPAGFAPIAKLHGGADVTDLIGGAGT